MTSERPEGDYIDLVVPDDGNKYEELRPIPQPSGQASTRPNNSSKTPQTNPVQAAASSPGAGNNGCRRPPCWGWAVLIAIFIMTAVLVAILVFLLRSAKTSPTSTMTSTSRVLAATTSSPTVNPDTTSTTTTRKTASSSPNPKNCQDVFNNGEKTSRVYSIYPDGQKQVKVFCEQTLDGGGWTVFQRRIDGSVNFYLGWTQYKQGFGVAAHEYWVGNDNLHALTADRDQKLKVELQHGGETVYADYAEFWVGNEDNLYALHVTGFSGANPPGDSLTPHNGRPFTTKDRDNDDLSARNCAQDHSGAWWYGSCDSSNLNGLYNENSQRGVTWEHWTGYSTSLSATRMMVKPR